MNQHLERNCEYTGLGPIDMQSGNSGSGVEAPVLVVFDTCGDSVCWSLEHPVSGF